MVCHTSLSGSSGRGRQLTIYQKADWYHFSHFPHATRGKCSLEPSRRLHSQQRLVGGPPWNLPRLLLRGNVCTRSGLPAESHFHPKPVFPVRILTLHINLLFSSHLSLISHSMSNFFTGWIIYNSFTNVFFSFLEGEIGELVHSADLSRR